jgi:hypothetical protein
MANTRTLSKTQEFGIIRQPGTNGAATAFHCGGGTTAGWGNYPVAGTNYRRVQYNKDSVSFDPMVTIDQYESTGQNGLHDETAQFFIDKLSGLPTVTFAMPADQKTLAPHLVGALGAVAEDAGTPYSKSITCNGLTGAVDFTATGVGADTWPLHAISQTDQASADDGKWIENCIIQDLTLDFDFNAQGLARLGQLSGTWVGTEINLEQTMAGTTVDTTLTPYNNAESYSFSTFTVDSIDWSSLAFRRFSFTVNNNVTKDDATTAGRADQFNIAPEYTSTIVLNYDATTEKVMQDFQQGSLVVATIASSVTPTVDGGLSIAGVKGQLMSQPEIFEGEYRGVNLDIKWFANGAATPVTIIQTDTQDWTYGDL